MKTGAVKTIFCLQAKKNIIPYLQFLNFLTKIGATQYTVTTPKAITSYLKTCPVWGLRGGAIG